MGIVAVFATAILSVTSCDKDVSEDIKTVRITKEKVTKDQSSAEISGKYDFPSVLKGIDVYLSKHEDLSNAKSHSAMIDDHEFTIKFDNLAGDTKYYYCYEFNNGLDKVRELDLNGELNVRSFKTEPFSDSEIKTDPVSNVKAKTAVSGGTIVSVNGNDVFKYGLCWGNSENPTIYSHKVEYEGSFTGHFDVNLRDLTPDRDYYVRAYFISNKDYAPVYGKSEHFHTKTGIPTINIEKVETGSGSAVCTYAVYDDNGLEVREHGICWSSLTDNPNLNNYEGHVGHVVGENEQGMGHFTANMTGLSAGKDYYVTAYAKNEDGFFYSTPKPFSLHTGTPVIVSFRVIQIKHKSAYLEAYITNDDNPAINIVNRGYCWSKTNPDPKIDNCDDSHNCGSGSGSTNYSLNGLDTEQNYYVRPYVKYNGDTYYYGEVKPFRTTKKGGLTKAFSVSGSDKVYFSQSNLQYKNQEWCFANNQWESIGTSQGNNYETTNRDLFGWGTSGYNHNDACYQPWSTITNNTKYWAYGQYYYNLSHESGKADWGYNKIMLPSTSVIAENVGWRTLTNSEWNYLVNNCKWSGHFSSGSIVVDGNTYHGNILLPDDWDLPESVTFTPNATNWTTNTYNLDQWYDMEAAGAVFLPAAGARWKISGSEAVDVVHHNNTGYYWTSTSQAEGTCWLRTFSASGYEANPAERYMGYSVRLVINE